MSNAFALSTEAIVLADVAIVLLAGAALVPLARRLLQPPVIAEITAGIMLGPSLLGLLPGHLSDHLFPAQARPVLSGIAQIGLVLFMFLAGWDMDLRRLRGRGTALTSLAAAAMLTPFCLGAATAMTLHGPFGPHRTGRAAFVLYLATAFSVTAFPVLARILKDRQIGDTRAGHLALSCAAVGDVAAWCVLPLPVALAGSGRAADAVTVLALTGVFVAAMVLLVRPLLARCVRDAPPSALSAGLTAGVLLASVATTAIGIHALFGAFAFGLAMPRDSRHAVRASVAVPLGHAAKILLPVYFVVTGLSVDVGSLGATGFVMLALVVSVAVIGKFTGAAVGARLWGMPWREAGLFGALMNTRGLTELVILGIGRDVGLIGPQLFTVMALMALVTTAMTGPLLHRFRPAAASPVGRHVPVPDSGAKADTI
ncbi:cation/H(+) antiporter [Streptomyces sp. SID5785]|uniref:cation:proton antiporter domain-containing protein n=1 Tax=Streptomyces sp. SID5785 TaxID=2690309 RepID=UPI001361B871|nr:cation:proton antiporter [Streptomyces sp. SID5785]MZD06079.1 cation/H(+) antiporter [Streptomyces sp. SID5785]